ncbi:glyoxalase superfamily protein [Rhizobium sp. FKL33]|uniref:glyoxalase superfamily protein n=1 Tax=Rhizobium sp. FKL33 TaxID=2562307 RepID=UPI0010C09F7F|nr:glyoxalase superfamily protein [Rhizobium sp. FKL33]
MSETSRLPSLEEIKAQARRLRDALASRGSPVTHSRSLELIAAQYGFRDWNTLHAGLGNRPPPRLQVGDSASGLYLGKPFRGKVVSLQRMNGSDDVIRVAFDFDEPVNVSKFESFDVFRKRVVCTLGPDGRTVEKTSDGAPHLQLA